MSLPIVWLRDATEDFVAAYKWYSEIRPELAARFLEAVNSAIAFTVQAPLLQATVYRNVRRTNLRRFPYGLFYVAEEHRILIVGCMHGKRDPVHWRSRVAP